MNTLSARTLRLRHALGSLTATSILFLAGCAMTSTAPSTDSFASSTGTLAGKVHGGQFPIYNSTVTLYAAGTGGYGKGSTQLAQTTTSLSGSWSLPTYTCPGTNPVIYLTAVGGNTQGTGLIATNNTASALMAVVGRCNSPISSTVNINEITTVASVFALAQYINPGTTAGTETMGTNSSTQAGVGIVNATAAIPNLANIALGAVPTPPTYTGTNISVAPNTVSSVNYPGITITATAESAKIITIANILASCINSASAASTTCVDLLTNALPPPNPAVTSQPSATFGTAVDTLQAAYYMAVNPIDAGTFATCTTTPTATTALGCLYGLAASNPPFQTGLSAQPTDWTIGITYTASGSCNHDEATTPWTFINGPAKEAVDAAGNLWFLNGAAGGSAALSAPFGAISPAGVPLACLGTGPYAGGNGSGITIDPTGNIWTSYNNAGATSGILEQPVATIATATTSNIWQTIYSVVNITSDGNGNIFATGGDHSVGNFLGGQLLELPSPGTVTTPFPATLVVTGLSTASTSNLINYSATDHTGNVWMIPNTYEAVYQAAPTSLAISSYTIGTGNTVTFFTTTAPPAAWSSGTQNIVVTGLTTTNGLLIDHQGYTVNFINTTPPYAFAATLIASPANTTSFPGANQTAPASPTLTASSNTTDTGIATGYTGGSWAEPSSSPLWGLAIDSSGYGYVGTNCCAGTFDHALVKVTPASPFSSSTQSTSSIWIGGDNGVRAIALDGAANIWFGSVFPELGTSTSPIAYGVGEAYTTGSGTSATFTNLSPNGATTTSCNSSGTTPGCPSGGGFQKASFLEPYDIAIDPSGNVWVPNTGSSSAGSGVNSYNGTSITEIIGAAVPVVTPISVGAANGTQATKP